VHLGSQVDFGALNDKTIKGLTYLSKIVIRFYLYIYELLLVYLLVNRYCMAHIGEDKYMSDPKA
jgi:hypothetical protein